MCRPGGVFCDLQVLLSLWMLPAAASGAGAAPPEAQHEARREIAAQRAGQGDWGGVVDVLNPLPSPPCCGSCCRRLAEAYSRLGQLVEAAWYYELAVQLDPGSREDLLALGRLHVARGLPALAIRALEAAAAHGVSDPEIHYQLARAYRQIGRPLAETHVLPISGAVPGRTHAAWYVLGVVEGEDNRYRVCRSNCAVYHLQKAIELGLGSRPGLDLLSADLWFEGGEFARARELYETIAETVPPEQRAGYHYRYGMTLFHLEDVEGLEHHLQLAVAADPGTYRPKLVEAYTLLADRYCLQGDVERTIRYLQLAVEARPRSIQHRYKLGNALFEARRRDEAITHWRMVLQLDPRHHDRRRLLELMEAHGRGPAAADRESMRSD